MVSSLNLLNQTLSHYSSINLVYLSKLIIYYEPNWSLILTFFFKIKMVDIPTFTMPAKHFKVDKSPIDQPEHF